VTLFGLHLDPVVLFLGVLGMAFLWRVGLLLVDRVGTRRVATVAIGLLASLLVISLAVPVIAPGLQFPSSRLLNWRLNGFGSRDSAAAQTTTVVTIEVERPYCDPFEVADPTVSYTPWAVIITMHMTDTASAAGCHSQQTPHEGSLPLVGGYLTGIFVPVHLSEPLGGRTLLDGSSFPPADRSLH
jgi:hypothetical protein